MQHHPDPMLRSASEGVGWLVKSSIVLVVLVVALRIVQTMLPILTDWK